MVMSWRIHQLDIPVSLKLEQKEKEVLQLIGEALDALGWLYDRDCLFEVNVNFDLSSSR